MRDQPHPGELFAAGRRHLFVWAHYDDEVPFSGLVQRARASGARPGGAPEPVHVLWTTNSDGLWFEDRVDPPRYADLRRRESEAAMACLGVPPSCQAHLGVSEIACYRQFAQMGRVRGGLDAGGVPASFRALADRVDAHVQAVDPDVVWTMAFQGGQPEHDLTHLMTVRAVERHERRRGAPIPVYEVPAYELRVVLFRYPPWKRGVRHAIELTDTEALHKARVADSFPSQHRLIGAFRKILGVTGALGALRGKPVTVEGFARTEVFQPVPTRGGTRRPLWDYTRSPHGAWRLDYPGDDYEGEPIRFDRTVARTAHALGMDARRGQTPEAELFA